MAQARKQSTKSKRRVRGRRDAAAPARSKIAERGALALHICADYAEDAKAALYAIRSLAAGPHTAEAFAVIQRLAFSGQCSANTAALHAKMWIGKLDEMGKKGGAR
jgi:hypothetical protein